MFMCLKNITKYFKQYMLLIRIHQNDPLLEKKINLGLCNNFIQQTDLVMRSKFSVFEVFEIFLSSV